MNNCPSCQSDQFKKATHVYAEHRSDEKSALAQTCASSKLKEPLTFGNSFIRQVLVAVVPLVISLALIGAPPSALAEPTSWEGAQAFVCAAKGKCLLPYDNADVQLVHSDLVEIDKYCHKTNHRVASIADRIAWASAKLDLFQNSMVLMQDFMPVAEAHCATYSIDSLLNAYVLERNHGATHQKTVADLNKNPKRLLDKWKGKQA